MRGLTFHEPSNRWKILCIDGTRVQYARAVMEAELGRRLRPGEVVHHINGDSTDDRPENLRLYESQAAHISAEHADGPRLYGPDNPSYRSDEEYLNILRTWVEEHGRLPMQKDFTGTPHPHHVTYLRRFGGFRLAVRLALGEGHPLLASYG